MKFYSAFPDDLANAVPREPKNVFPAPGTAFTIRARGGGDRRTAKIRGSGLRFYFFLTLFPRVRFRFSEFATFRSFPETPAKASGALWPGVSLEEMSIAAAPRTQKNLKNHVFEGFSRPDARD
jgi:hypothetical protein